MLGHSLDLTLQAFHFRLSSSPQSPLCKVADQQIAAVGLVSMSYIQMYVKRPNQHVPCNTVRQILANSKHIVPTKYKQQNCL